MEKVYSYCLIVWNIVLSNLPEHELTLATKLHVITYVFPSKLVPFVPNMTAVANPYIYFYSIILFGVEIKAFDNHVLLWNLLQKRIK